MELALVTPILLLILVGAVDLGRIFYARITVSNAAREAALEAAHNPTSFSAGQPCSASNRVICAATHENAGSWVTIAPADVAMSCSGSCSASYGTTVAVTVTGRFNLLTPLLAAFTGGSAITFSDTATADVITSPAGGILPTAAPSATPTATPSPTPTPGPSATATATPTATPRATATPTPAPTCTPATVSFTSRQASNGDDDHSTSSIGTVNFTSLATPTSGSCRITYWRWAYGDGKTDAGNLPTVSHDFGSNNNGKWFTVTLTVTTPAGTFSYTASVKA